MFIVVQQNFRLEMMSELLSKVIFFFIPANTPHSDTFIGDEPFVMLDIFYPIREYFLEKLPAK
jgi:quercetin dioxygenase-like cupin family protein